MVNEIARSLIVIGLCIAGLGGLFLLMGKFPGVGRLPGDILIKKENFTFYFPLTTSILVSIVLSLIFFLLNKSK